MSTAKERVERVQALSDKSVYNALIKAHLDNNLLEARSTWNSIDMDTVVGQFAAFLTGVAHTGKSISETTLTACLRSQTSGQVLDAVQAPAFAKAMKQALSHCRQKAKNVVSGTKTSDPVLQVIRAMKISTQASSPSASPSPTPTAPRTPKRRKRDDGQADLEALQQAWLPGLPDAPRRSQSSLSSSVVDLQSPQSISSSADSPVLVSQSAEPVASELPKEANSSKTTGNQVIPFCLSLGRRCRGQPPEAHLAPLTPLAPAGSSPRFRSHRLG